MKRIYNLLFLSCSLLLMIACSSDDYDYKAPESLDLISSDLYFKSSGGNGTVEVNTDKGITATSSVDWCNCTVSNHTVTVIVNENIEKESRDAVINITDEEGLETQLALHQEGLVVKFETEGFTNHFTNTGGSTSLTISSTSPYTVNVPESASSWLSYTDEDGKITFTCTPNETGSPHATQVTITSGSVTRVLSLSQFEITDLIGNWEAEYINSDGESMSTTVNLKQDEEGNLSLDIPVEAAGEIYNFPCQFSDGYLNIQAGSPLGMFYSVYYLYSVVFSTDGYISWNSDLSYGGVGTTDDSGGFILAFGDNGSWTDRVINGMGIWAFSSTDLSSDSSLGYIEEILDLVLHK